LFELKGYNVRYLVRVFQKKLKCHQHLQLVVAIVMGHWLVDRLYLAVADDIVPTLMLLTNWYYTKMDGR